MENQLWLVIEDMGDGWEKWGMPIAAFPTEAAAHAFKEKTEQAYDEKYAHGVAQWKLLEAETDALSEDLPRMVYQAEVNRIVEGYPDAIYDESKHTFSVSKPIPFYPAV